MVRKMGIYLLFLALPINILGNICLRGGVEDTQDNVLTLILARTKKDNLSAQIWD